VNGPERAEDTARFYRALRRLEDGVGGVRALSRLDGVRLPARGVYFFFEPGESRGAAGPGLRVVRIGTHALKRGGRTTLSARLRWHRGAPQTGGGNHRGSIFRLLVGAALAARDPALGVASWGRGSSAPREVRARETDLERLVSRVIGAMPVLCLAVEDPPGPESLRGYVERNAIALLSGYAHAPMDAPSGTWLGRHCPREKVRRSGLWNQRHVDEGYDRAFLSTLEALVDEHIGKGDDR